MLKGCGTTKSVTSVHAFHTHAQNTGIYSVLCPKHWYLQNFRLFVQHTRSGCIAAISGLALICSSFSLCAKYFDAPSRGMPGQKKVDTEVRCPLTPKSQTEYQSKWLFNCFFTSCFRNPANTQVKRTFWYTNTTAIYGPCSE